MDERDESKIYNSIQAAQLAHEAPGFPWDRYLAAANLAAIDRIIIVDRSAVLGRQTKQSKNRVAPGNAVTNHDRRGSSSPVSASI